MSNQKTYVPKSSIKERIVVLSGQKTQFINVGLHVDEFKNFMEQHVNERGYINLTIGRRKTPSDRGDTHSLWLDDYKPKERTAAAHAQQQQQGFGDVASGFPGKDQEEQVPF